MAWNQWMVPELTPETEFRLKAAALEITEAMRHTPQVVGALAVQLAHQAALQESIIRKATARICELEAQAAAAGRSDRPEWLDRAARGLDGGARACRRRERRRRSYRLAVVSSIGPRVRRPRSRR